LVFVKSGEPIILYFAFLFIVGGIVMGGTGLSLSILILNVPLSVWDTSVKFVNGYCLEIKGTYTLLTVITKSFVL